MSAWTAEAEAAASGQWEERFLVARLPERFVLRRGDRDESYRHELSEWELGVLVCWGMEADWERLTVTLRVPGPVAVHLLSPGSNLSCRTPEEAAAEPVAVPEQLVESGVFDDGPVGERRPVTTGHLRALRTISRGADQLYLVLSTANGPEVISLSVLEQRVRAGGRYIIAAAAGDLPEGILPKSPERAAETDSLEGGSVWPPRIHDSQDPDFARHLSAAEGEQVVARLMRGSRGETGAALRSLSLARGVADLRVFEGAYDERGHRRGVFPYDVWHGLLAMETLHLAPFRPVSEDRFRGVGEAALFGGRASGDLQERDVVVEVGDEAVQLPVAGALDADGGVGGADGLGRRQQRLNHRPGGIGNLPIPTSRPPIR
ncbi:hypothetical protein [Streptomyces sp. NPDC003435]